MSSWFHRLRRKTAGPAIASGAEHEPEPPAAPPCSPSRGRASYYVPTRDRASLPRRPRASSGSGSGREDNPKLRDTHFPSSPDIVFDVVARRDDRFSAAPPDLKLRPILTRPPAPRSDADADAGSGSAAAASPTARRFHFHHANKGQPDHRRRKKKKADEEARARRRSRSTSRRRLRRLRCWWVYESLVVVKESADPEEDFLESIAEMIAANHEGLRSSPRGLEDLLACYLALNAADHHRAIVAAFRRAWLHLHLVPPPPTRERRCINESSVNRG